jgi:hypothetical protein
MNLNKFTKAELISKLEDLKKLELKNSKKSEGILKQDDKTQPLTF